MIAQTDWVLDALEQALWSHRNMWGLVHPCDRGCQYLSVRYMERLRKPVLKPPSAAGVTQTINGLYKDEVIDRRGPCKNSEAAENATLEWVDGFDHRRMLEPIANMPPEEWKAEYDRQQEESAQAA